MEISCLIKQKPIMFVLREVLLSNLTINSAGKRPGLNNHLKDEYS